MSTRTIALATTLAMAIGASVFGSAPAAAHNGSCTGTRTVTAVGRTVTGTERITCDYQHQQWHVCVALYWRDALAGGEWHPAADHCHYEDNTGTGSTKRIHEESESAMCNTLNGPLQEWWFGSSWQVGDGDNPHYGGGSTTITVLCV